MVLCAVPALYFFGYKIVVFPSKMWYWVNFQRLGHPTKLDNIRAKPTGGGGGGRGGLDTFFSLSFIISLSLSERQPDMD